MGKPLPAWANEQLKIQQTIPQTPLEVLVRTVCLSVSPSKVVEVRDFLNQPASGMVYILRCHDRVKIGFTSLWERRFRVLKTACPYPVTVVAVIPGGRDLELFLHRGLEAYRAHGEWFEEVGAVREITHGIEGLSVG